MPICQHFLSVKCNNVKIELNFFNDPDKSTWWCLRRGCSRAASRPEQVPNSSLYPVEKRLVLLRFDQRRLGRELLAIWVENQVIVLKEQSEIVLKSLGDIYGCSPYSYTLLSTPFAAYVIRNCKVTPDYSKITESKSHVRKGWFKPTGGRT